MLGCVAPGEGGCWRGAGLLGPQHLVKGQRWGGPPKVGLGLARTLQKNDLGRIMEALLQGQRGAVAPLGSHSRHWGRGGPRLPAQVSSVCQVAGLPPSWPSAAPACGEQCSPVERGQVHPVTVCWVAPGRVLPPSGLGFPICGGRVAAALGWSRGRGRAARVSTGLLPSRWAHDCACPCTSRVC